MYLKEEQSIYLKKWEKVAGVVILVFLIIEWTLYFMGVIPH